MEKTIIAKVKIWDEINGKFRPTRFKLEKILRNSVIISGVSYARKGERLIGRVIISDFKHKMGMSFPIYA